jgi:tetratricopeptide (TPR) repeat protein
VIGGKEGMAMTNDRRTILTAVVLLGLACASAFAGASMTREQSIAETKKTLVIYKQQMQKGDLKGAEASARRMMALAKGREGEQSPGYAICISHLAEVYNAAGKIVETAQCFEKALEIQRKHGPGTRHIATIMNNLGYCYLDLGATEKAVPLFKESVEITTKLYGKNHIDTVNRMHALARAYLRAGKFADAELLLKETLSLVEKDLGKKHDLYASILSDYAQLYAMKKEYGKAKTICMEAVALRKEINGELHPKTLQILTNMGILMRCAGDYKGAENLYLEQLQKLGSRKEPVYQTIRAGILQGLGNIYTLTGNYDKAEPRFKESLKIYIGLYGEGFSSVLDVYLSLIPLYREMGRGAGDPEDPRGESSPDGDRLRQSRSDVRHDVQNRRRNQDVREVP